MKIIDITQELFSCRVYPGDKQPIRKQVKTIEQDRFGVSIIKASLHAGTHIDAPIHVIPDAKAVHELDLSIFYGKCTVVEFEGIVDETAITGILQNCRERLLFKGQNELTESAAAVLANSHVKLIGVESQSVGVFDRPLPVHKALLGSEIIPLEGLNLSSVAPGEYTLAAFPLNMKDSDGSPVRAVLIEEAG